MLRRDAGQREKHVVSAPDSRRGAEAVESIALQDHKGDTITFKEFFHGRPSIVVFFYTRCDNPMKCSLTVTKLARIQKLLEVMSTRGPDTHGCDYIRSGLRSARTSSDLWAGPRRPYGRPSSNAKGDR